MEAKLVTLIVECLRVDLRFGEERADDVDVSLLDGGVQRVVAPVVHGREVHAVLQQHGADRRKVVLGRHVQGGLTMAKG